MMNKKIAAFALSIMMVVTMTPMIAFANSDDGEEALEATNQYANSMRIYGFYMHRANGSKVSSDRYGDAVLIESNGKYILMDTGTDTPIKDSSTRYQSNLVSALKSIGVTELDVYFSHMHGDHIGGFQDICNSFKVNKLYLPDIELCKEYHTPNTGKTIAKIYSEQVEIATAENAEIVYLAPEFREHQAETVSSGFSVGGARFDVIGPVGTYTLEQFEAQDGICGTMEGHYLNCCSLCTMVKCGNFRYLSTGDIEQQEENKLVSRYAGRLNADVMKMNHHSLYTSNTAGFISNITPMWSFEQNHGFSGGSISDSINTAKKYGYNYAVASNQHTIIIDVNNNAVRVYRDYDNNNLPDDGLLTGWVSCGGGTQYYDGAGYIHTGWNWISGYAYYMSGSSGFRYTGTHKINGVKVKFSSSGKLTSHKKPAKVKARSAKAKKGGKIKVRWKKAARASRYQVFRATSKKGTYVCLGTYGKGKRSITNSGLVCGQKYFYKVRAIRYVAGGTMYGSFSKVKSAKAK